MKSIEFTEADRFVNQIEDPIVRLVAAFTLYAGLRLTTSLHLQEQDVDIDQGVIHVWGEDGYYQVPIPLPLVSPLMEYAQSTELEKGVFPFIRFPDGRPAEISYFNHAVVQTAKRLGFGKINFHTLRRAFVCNWIRSITVENFDQLGSETETLSDFQRIYQGIFIHRCSPEVSLNGIQKDHQDDL